MSTPVVMPQMGESIAEGTIVRWIKKVGDAVDRDEPLFEISTDKVDAEIPSPVAGVLLDIAVKEGLVASIKEEIKGLEAEIERAAADASAARAAGRMHINKSGSISSNIRSKQGRISTLQAEMAQMRGRL